MWRGITIGAFLILGLCGVAQALPPIIIYNYNIPLPQLEVVSLTPADHQEFTVAPPQGALAVFSQSVDFGASDLKVYDQYNNLISSPKQSTRDSSIGVSLPSKMYSGVYRMEWKGTCLCKGHPTVNGTSHFTVD